MLSTTVCKKQNLQKKTQNLNFYNKAYISIIWTQTQIVNIEWYQMADSNVFGWSPPARLKTGEYNFQIHVTSSLQILILILELHDRFATTLFSQDLLLLKTLFV